MSVGRNVHNLEIYPHTAARSCLGCVWVDDPEDAGESRDTSAAPTAPASGAAGPPAVSVERTAPAASPPPEETLAPPVVLRARWTKAGEEVDRCPVGTSLVLEARAYLADGQPALVAVAAGGGGPEATLAARVDGERVSVAWCAARAGTYRFTVAVGASSAVSAELAVEGEKAPLKLRHVGEVLRRLLDESRVVARWFLEDLSYEFLCGLAEQGDADPENDPAQMPRTLCLLPGMQGDDVRAVQRALAALGFPATDTGLFDGATKAALIAWLSAVQPDRDTPASAASLRVAPGDTFAGACGTRRVSDWTDLWADAATRAEDDPDVPAGLAFALPARAQRRGGCALLEETGRDTAPAYGGLAFVSPVEVASRTLVFDDGARAEIPHGFAVTWEGAVTAGQPQGARFEARVARGAQPRLRLEASVRPAPEIISPAGEGDA
ncbi:MAG TPA: peptidoglycan-binding domain-containing protein [Myxococcota bacterium]|jgi:peptidoglycan hydrolase-like protein with peptidoglycan-binding domain|nr:peptidoglycan-binding domain-containing protein [Myxococcota bacterium]